MNSVFYNPMEFTSFSLENTGIGKLKIRAYAANEALPVEGLHIVVTSKIDDKDVIFFDGKTDSSGLIEVIELPAPKNDDNMIIPKTTTYMIIVDSKDKYVVDMYDGICVVQNINYVPGGFYGN